MKGIIDIHTHRDNPELGSALISIGLDSNKMNEGQYYSVGLHPWYYSKVDEKDFDEMKNMLSDPRVVAIGECGLDSLRGPSLDVQKKIFLRQVEISEICRKPLIVHQVKSIDTIIEIKKKINPKQRWLIHGYRGNPIMLRSLFSLGFDVSFGNHYNKYSVMAVPLNKLFIETDEFTDVFSVYNSISTVLSRDAVELMKQVSKNSDDFLRTSFFAV